MARKLRVEYARAVNQVLNRGDRWKGIFEADQDRRRFLETVAEAGKAGWQIHAVKAERLVVGGLKRLGWDEAMLKAKRKGDRGKVALAEDLRAGM